jgi:hypothetical protein
VFYPVENFVKKHQLLIRILQHNRGIFAQNQITKPKMKRITSLFLLIAITLMTSAKEIVISTQKVSTGNKGLHLYNGNIEIVKDGFVVTFFYSGRYRLTISTEDGELLYYGEINAIADQPIYIPTVGVSPEEDNTDGTF